MNTPTLISKENPIVSKKENIELFSLFGVENIEDISPNDFYLIFREFLLTGNREHVLKKIKQIACVINKQDFYDTHLSYFKYFQINIAGDEFHFLDDSIFQENSSLESFLDTLSIRIHDTLYPVLQEHHQQGGNICLTSLDIQMSPGTKGGDDIFGFKKGEGESFLYLYIRQFIIGRGLHFPKIKEYSSASGEILMEGKTGVVDKMLKSINNTISALDGAVPPATKEDFNLHPNYPNASNFILSLIKSFGENPCDSTTAFFLGNMLALYLHENAQYLNITDAIDILKSSIQHGGMIHYMLTSEGEGFVELFQVFQREGIENINNADNDYIQSIYLASHIGSLLEHGYTILISNSGEFSISKSIESKAESLLKDSIDIKKYERVQIFLGSNETPLLEDHSYKLNLTCLLAQEIAEKMQEEYQLVITASSPKKDIELCKHIFIDSISTIPKIEQHSIELAETVGSEIISTYRASMEAILKGGKEAYNKLSLGFDTLFRPIGGKVHFNEFLSRETLDKLKDLYHFSSTPFQLLHANTSMLLPPCESPFQLIEVLRKLHNLGVISDGNLELQLSIAGRLPNELCGILASTIIFLKNYQITYPSEAFYTSHDELTKGCIVCYDAGVLDTEGFKNIPKEMTGRTDMLGVRQIEEVVNFSIISNLISQAHFGGELESEGKLFIQEYKTLLEKYEVSNILNGKWVHNPTLKGGDNNFLEYKKHYSLVSQCTSILNDGIEQYNTSKSTDSLIFELRALLAGYVQRNKLIPSSGNLKQIKS